ncbi:hypothetical protein M3231_27055 [Neobacillus mesonae]|nr:hypothetical protein [Neobacillus mesonae]
MSWTIRSLTGFIAASLLLTVWNSVSFADNSSKIFRVYIEKQKLHFWKKGIL